MRGTASRSFRLRARCTRRRSVSITKSMNGGAPSIGNYLDWLFTREAFDVLFVNYTYLTRAFMHAPGSTVKVLEMHDLFTGRKELFAANGEQPDFFYMVAEQGAHRLRPGGHRHRDQGWRGSDRPRDDGKACRYFDFVLHA